VTATDRVLAAVLLLWNLGVALLYGWDKLQARRGGRRVSERRLLLAAWLAGAPGALLGMALFRHKVSKASFRLAFLAVAVLNPLWYLLAVWTGLLPPP